MKFNLKLINFSIAQFGIVTLILILALLSIILSNIFHIYCFGCWRLFNVGNEQSIPTYFSALNLLLSSIFLFIIYWYEKAHSHKGYKYWLFLSILFLFLSFDESISIHELSGKLYTLIVHKGMLPPYLETHTWLLFGVLFVLIIGFGLIPFYKSLSRTTLYYFVFSGLIFLTGAVGLEFTGALMFKTGFIKSFSDLYYIFCRLFEEAFEMYGIAIFNYALYREILQRKINLIISCS